MDKDLAGKVMWKARKDEKWENDGLKICRAKKNAYRKRAGEVIFWNTW